MSFPCGDGAMDSMTAGGGFIVFPHEFNGESGLKTAPFASHDVALSAAPFHF